jgi:hypothetical protein
VMERKTKRTIAVSVGSGMFAVAFVAPSMVLPFAETSPMLLVVGVAAPTGIGFAVLSWINYVAARHDVRVSREVEPEPELKAGLR